MWNGGNGTETSATDDGQAEDEEYEEDIFHWQDTLMREVGKNVKQPISPSH